MSLFFFFLLVALPTTFSQDLGQVQSKFNTLGLGPHLFVKVPQLGDSEVCFAVFKSSCHLLLLV